MAGASPERTFSSTFCAAKNATVSAAFGRSRSASTTRPSARTSSGNGGSGPAVGSGASDAPERQHAPPAARLRARPLGERRVGGGEPLRRAQHEPLVAEVERAPAPPGGERHLRDDAARVDVRQPGVRDRLQRRVARRARWRRSSRQRARQRRLRPRPSAGTSPTTRSVGSVSVPVLSVQTTSTDASDSTAFSCCASTPRWATLNADTAAVRLIRRIRPSGTRFTMPGGQGLHARRARCRRGRRTETASPTASGTREREQPQQQPVVGPLERRARVAERARGGGQPRRPALRADRRRLERAPRPRRRTSPTRPARPAPRTTGSDSPVRLASSSASPSADTHRPVGDHLVAGRQTHEVADDDLLDRHPAVDPVAHDHRLGRDQRGQPVERALGADLLERPDRDVRDQDPEEQRVLPRPERDRQHAEEEQDPVRDVQRVGADDAGVRAARALTRGLPRRQACRLGLGQAGRCELSRPPTGVACPSAKSHHG